MQITDDRPLYINHVCCASCKAHIPETRAFHGNNDYTIGRSFCNATCESRFIQKIIDEVS